MALLNQTQQQYYSGSDYGNYQFTSLKHIINQFIVAYVGEDKIIPKIKRTDVQFHAMRALQELSFDTFKSCKSHEIEVPSSLTMILPQDYVNYIKLTWSDSAGIEHVIYPTSKTSNPSKINQNSDGTYYSNLILNSDFQNGIENWSLIGSSSSGLSTQLYHTTSSDGLLLSSNGLGSASFPLIQQNVTLVDGQTYQLSWNLVSFDNGNGGGPSKVFLFGGTGTGGVNSYRPASGNNNLTTIGPQAPIEFTFDASQNNGMNTMSIAVEMTNGNNFVKKVEIKDFLLVRINNDGNYGMSDGTIVDSNDSTTWSNYKSGTPSENQDDYQDDTFWPMAGERYGLDPQHAQVNGSFYMDCNTGKIHFSSNISGKTVILEYISDGLGTDEEMQVHKFAEEAMYKWIVYAILSTRMGIPEYIINRYKKERFAETRKAKIRLSNIKLEEITQILRGKSKQIKH